MQIIFSSLEKYYKRDIYNIKIKYYNYEINEAEFCIYFCDYSAFKRINFDTLDKYGSREESDEATNNFRNIAGG